MILLLSYLFIEKNNLNFKGRSMNKEHIRRTLSYQEKAQGTGSSAPSYKQAAANQLNVRRHKISAQAPLASNHKRFQRPDNLRNSTMKLSELFQFTMTLPTDTSFDWQNAAASKRLPHQTSTKNKQQRRNHNLPGSVSSGSKKRVRHSFAVTSQASVSPDTRRRASVASSDQKYSPASKREKVVVLVDKDVLDASIMIDMRHQGGSKLKILPKPARTGNLKTYPDITEKYPVQALDLTVAEMKLRRKARKVKQFERPTDSQKADFSIESSHVVNMFASKGSKTNMSKQPLNLHRQLTNPQPKKRKTTKPTPQMSSINLLHVGADDIDQIDESLSARNNSYNNRGQRITNSTQQHGRHLSVVMEKGVSIQAGVASGPNTRLSSIGRNNDLDQTIVICGPTQGTGSPELKQEDRNSVSPQGRRLVEGENSSPQSIKVNQLHGATLVSEQVVQMGSVTVSKAQEKDSIEEFKWTEAPALFKVDHNGFSQNYYSQKYLAEAAFQEAPLNLQIPTSKPFKTNKQHRVSSPLNQNINRFDNMMFKQMSDQLVLPNDHIVDDGGARYSRINDNVVGMQSSTQLLRHKGAGMGKNDTIGAGLADVQGMPLTRLNTMKQKKTTTEFEGLKQQLQFGSSILNPSFLNQKTQNDDGYRMHSETSTSMFFIDGPPLGLTSILAATKNLNNHPQQTEHMHTSEEVYNVLRKSPSKASKSILLSKKGSLRLLNKPSQKIKKQSQPPIAKRVKKRHDPNARSPLEQSLSNNSVSRSRLARESHIGIKVEETAIRAKENTCSSYESAELRDEDEDDFEVSDHVPNDSVFLQHRPQNIRGASYGGQDLSQRGPPGGAYQEPQLHDYLSQKTYPRPVMNSVPSRIGNKANVPEDSSHNQFSHSKFGSMHYADNKSSMHETASFLSQKDQNNSNVQNMQTKTFNKKFDQQDGSKNQERQTFVNKFASKEVLPRGTTLPYMQSTMPAFHSRAGASQDSNVLLNHQSLNPLASQRLQSNAIGDTTEIQNHLSHNNRGDPFGKKRASISTQRPKILNQKANVDQMSNSGLSSTHQTKFTSSIYTYNRPSLAGKTVRQRPKNEGEFNLTTKNVNSRQIGSIYDQTPVPGNKLLPIKNRLQVKQKLAGKSHHTYTSVKNNSSVNEEIKSLKHVQDRAQALGNILSLTEQQHSSSNLPENRASQRDKNSRYHNRHHNKPTRHQPSSGTTDLSFYNPNESVTSLSMITRHQKKPKNSDYVSRPQDNHLISSMASSLGNINQQSGSMRSTAFLPKELDQSVGNYHKPSLVKGAGLLQQSYPTAQAQMEMGSMTLPYLQTDVPKQRRRQQQNQSLGSTERTSLDFLKDGSYDANLGVKRAKTKATVHKHLIKQQPYTQNPNSKEQTRRQWPNKVTSHSNILSKRQTNNHSLYDESAKATFHGGKVLKPTHKHKVSASTQNVLNMSVSEDTSIQEQLFIPQSSIRNTEDIDDSMQQTRNFDSRQMQLNQSMQVILPSMNRAGNEQSTSVDYLGAIESNSTSNLQSMGSIRQSMDNELHHRSNMVIKQNLSLAPSLQLSQHQLSQHLGSQNEQEFLPVATTMKQRQQNASFDQEQRVSEALNIAKTLSILKDQRLKRKSSAYQDTIQSKFSQGQSRQQQFLNIQNASVSNGIGWDSKKKQSGAAGFKEYSDSIIKPQ